MVLIQVITIVRSELDGNNINKDRGLEESQLVFIEKGPLGIGRCRPSKFCKVLSLQLGLRITRNNEA